MRGPERHIDGLAKRIKQASRALESVEDLNEMLAMPPAFHEIVKGKRRPVHE